MANLLFPMQMPPGGATPQSQPMAQGMQRMQGTPQLAQGMQHLKNIVQMLNSAKNPEAVLQQISQKNPAIKQVMDMCKGKNPQQVFYEICQQKGVNPQEIINMLK